MNTKVDITNLIRGGMKRGELIAVIALNRSGKTFKRQIRKSHRLRYVSHRLKINAKREAKK